MTAKIEAYCQTCGEFIPEPNVAYGISPDALCRCCKHDRIAAHAPKQEPSVPVSALRLACLRAIDMNNLYTAIQELIHAAEKEGSSP